MRIAIDARMIGPFMHGISRYAYNLIKCISEADKKNDYVLLLNDNFLKDFVSTRENFSLKITKSRLYGVREQITIPRVLKEEKIDIFHSPSFFGPVLEACKVIMTIHDMIHILFPEESSILHRAYYSFIVRRAAENASRIITVSENSRRDIANFLSVPLEKIVVTYNAVDRMFRRSNEDKVNEIRDRLDIKDRYILYVGNQKPHKNVGLLIEAYQQLRGRINHQLVIVGQKDRLFLKSLRNNMLEGVIFIGEVSDEFLPHLYSGADVFVSPSLYEGFGLPPLEAMACGVPVITSNTSSLPEVIDNAGIMVDPNDVNSLCEAMYNVLKDKKLWHHMSKKGLERAKLFSWKETAKKILGIYDEVLSKNN